MIRTVWILLVLPLVAWAQTPVPVSVQPFSELARYAEGDAPATVVALNDSRIAARLGAPVEAIPVRVGDVVAAGAPLVRLECGDFERSVVRQQAALEALQAQWALARYRLDRARTLAEANNVSEETLEQRRAEERALEAQVQGQRAALEQARAEVERCTASAPFRALVTGRLVGVGELAAVGTPLVQVLDLERLEVVARVSARDAGDLLASGELALRVDGSEYPLQLRTLLPALDPRSRSREARLLFADGGEALPGSAGRLIWRSRERLLPAEFVLKRNNLYGVFVVEAGNARFVPLPAAQEGRPAAVDLPEDAQVAVEGRHALQPGAPVQVQ